MRAHFPPFADGCLKRVGDGDSPISVYRKQFIWFKCILKRYFVRKWFQMPFREELLVRKGEQYYPQTFEFVSSLPNPN